MEIHFWDFQGALSPVTWRPWGGFLEPQVTGREREEILRNDL